MRRAASRSTVGRIAAAMISPRKTSAITIRTFQRRGRGRSLRRRRASPRRPCGRYRTSQGRFSPCSTGCKRRSEAASGERGRAMLARDEQVCFDARRHGVSLARPLAQAALLAGAGAVLLAMPWPPLAVPGAALVVIAAAVCLRAVWLWERTRLVVTTEKVCVIDGTLRRRSSAVRLRSVESLELEQTLPGRLLGYGTLVAGPLEIEHVPHPRTVYRLVERLAG